MKKVFVWFFGKRAVGANPAVKGHWWAVALLVILISSVTTLPFVWNKIFYTNMPPNVPADIIAEAPSYPEGTAPGGGTVAGSVPAAITKALKEGKGEDVFFELKEMTYGDGETGQKLGEAKRLKAAAEVEAAKAKAKADASAAKAKAEEMRLIGAYLIGRAAEQREEALAAIEVVKANLGRREAAYRINLLEAEAGSANARQINDEAVRIYYKGRRMEASIALDEAKDVLPEVRTVPRTTPPLTPAERISAAKTRAEVAEAEAKACEAEAAYRVYKAGPKLRGSKW